MDPMGRDPNDLGFDMPLMNQPPQIFGAYTSDGSPIPPSLNGQLFADDMGLGDDSNDAKRRRIARVRSVPPRSIQSRLI
jgi:hypothetical protein